MGAIVIAALAGLTGVVIAGNLVIAVASAVARRRVRVLEASEISFAGVSKFRVVDASLWRGAAPSLEGFRALAGHGVRVVVDLRAERDASRHDASLARLGIRVVRIPIRDGQAPTSAQVEQFLGLVRAGPEPVFVHCGAGVGRTGSLVGAWLVASGQASGVEAAWANLAVGPPSLEQLAFTANFDPSGPRGHAIAIVVLSRLLDAPRRLWHWLTDRPHATG